MIVKDTKTGKSRGYAFVEFEKDKDLKVAYNEADGLKIQGRRIVVDVERGRTVKGWLPRRLGGGLGKTRVGAPKQNQKYSGRDTGNVGSTTTSAPPAAVDDGYRDRHASRSSGGYRDDRRGGYDRGGYDQRRDYGDRRGGGGFARRGDRGGFDHGFDRRRSRSPPRQRDYDRERYSFNFDV